jgi:peptidoglycan hydrolase-like protein with peptidoglycan-binding domain
MPLNRVAYPTGNYSSRGGAAVRLIVLHTAEGATNIADLGAWFANPASGVSSHVGVDDTANTVGEYVRRDYKAWTAANYNPVAVQAELCAFAAWDTATWNTHPNMLANCAAWIAEEAARFAIPLVKLTPQQAQGSGRGVCQHADLGAGGGNHWDCGPGFPVDAVLALAGGVTPAPPPTPPVSAPPWPGRYLAYPPVMTGDDVAVWQAQMSARGWPLDVDGAYGPVSEEVCVEFQAEKGLSADGIVGPDTWDAAWTAPVT